MSTEEKPAVEGVGTNSSNTAITDHDNNLTLHKVSIMFYSVLCSGNLVRYGTYSFIF